MRDYISNNEKKQRKLTNEVNILKIISSLSLFFITITSALIMSQLNILIGITSLFTLYLIPYNINKKKKLVKKELLNTNKEILKEKILKAEKEKIKSNIDSKLNSTNINNNNNLSTKKKYDFLNEDFNEEIIPENKKNINKIKVLRKEKKN